MKKNQKYFLSQLCRKVTVVRKQGLRTHQAWSGWGIQKNIYFRNTTTGSVVVPTNWRDAWSYQILTRYAKNERIAILGAVLYETNVNPTVTNNIGYPVSNSAFISAGVDVSLQKSISLQLMYGYGLFTLKSKIDTSKSNGSVSANTQAAVVQLTVPTLTRRSTHFCPYRNRR